MVYGSTNGWHRQCKSVYCLGDHGEPFSSWRRWQQVTTETMVMKKDQRETASEPIGIVISSGSTVERPPMFWAYVWGPAPEIDTPSKEPVRN